MKTERWLRPPYHRSCAIRSQHAADASFAIRDNCCRSEETTLNPRSRTTTQRVLFAVLVFLVASPCLGAIKSTAYSPTKTVEVAQWQVLDISFTSETPVKKPFSVQFEAKFTGTNGQALVVPGFYDGEDRWVLRFSTAATGTWRFQTQSSIAALSGLTGQVTVTPNQDPDQHGGITIDKDRPQHFVYEDGSPAMLLAFECDWLFALDYANEQAAPKTSHLLQLLSAHGVNQIVTTLYSYDVKWTKDERLKEHPEHEYGGRKDIFPFLGSNEAPDYSALNVTFFQRFDRVMSLMHDHKIAAHLMIYVWNKSVNWPDAESEADNLYFDYIIKRYQAFPNTIWDVSKEALNNKRCTEEYGRERIARIGKLDAYDRLVTVHDYGFCERNFDVVDFISIQSWSSTLYKDMVDIRTAFPNKPLLNIEHGGYEQSPYVVFPGDYTDPEICLRRNYLIGFAGAYSTYYWQGTSWNVIIHNPFEQPKDFAKPKFIYYKHLADFFKRYRFSELTPDLKSNNSGCCLTDSNGLYLVYVPKYNYQVSVNWRSPIHSNTGTFQWFNTLTGEYSEQQPCMRHFINPWHNQADAILIRQHEWRK